MILLHFLKNYSENVLLLIAENNCHNQYIVLQDTQQLI